MSTRAVILVLASALVHASWNAILKRQRAPEDAVVGISITSSIFAVFFAVVMGPAIGSTSGLVWCVSAGVLEAAYFQVLARALARAGLGPGYTVSRGGALLVVWPISVIVLGEPITLLRVAGSALVFCGLVATGYASPPAKPSAVVSSGIAYALATALCIGGYHLSYKLALARGVTPWTANGVSLGIAGMLNVVVASPERRRRAFAALREAPVASGLAGLFATGSFVMFLTAMTETGAGLVLTLRNTSILFAQGFAFLLGERPRGLAIGGAALVTVGAALLMR